MESVRRRPGSRSRLPHGADQSRLRRPVCDGEIGRRGEVNIGSMCLGRRLTGWGQVIESRQISKVQLALRGGLRSSDQEHSELKRRIAHLQQFKKIIGSTILSRDAA